jgi:hypothetical protein
MAKSLKIGHCHICGSYGKLSFEHVPPESAFNDQKVVTPDMKKVFELANLDDLNSLSGKQSQRGQGGYTLCGSCNSQTGGWYGRNYATWVSQGAAYLAKSNGNLHLSYPYHLLPLRVIKQIVCMFFSANSPRFREVHPVLERFVLNKEAKYLPPEIHIYAGYLLSNRSRTAGVTSSVHFDEKSGTSRFRTYSEISFYPFSYILSFNSPPPEHPMVDISFFAQYGYDEFTTLQLPISVLSVYTPFPGDFRSRETVLRESNMHNP